MRRYLLPTCSATRVGPVGLTARFHVLLRVGGSATKWRQASNTGKADQPEAVDAPDLVEQRPSTLPRDSTATTRECLTGRP